MKTYTDELTPIDSIIPLFEGANWYEREVSIRDDNPGNLVRNWLLSHCRLLTHLKIFIHLFIQENLYCCPTHSQEL